MTAIVVNPFETSFEFDLNLGRKVLDKTDKLTERVSTAVVNALSQDDVQFQVDQQFDVVIVSVNEQLRTIESEIDQICSNLKLVDAALIAEINNPNSQREHIGDRFEVVSELALFALHLIERSIDKAIQRLEQSGIDRVCVADCVELLSSASLKIAELCAIVEQIAEHFRISNALLEKSLTSSDNPILNRLLEKYRG